MTSQGSATSPGANQRRIGVGALLALVALAGYFLSGRRKVDLDANARPSASVVTSAPQRGTTATAGAPAKAPVTLPSPVTATSHEREVHAHSRSHSENPPFPPSHPIDEQRRRIYRENNFHAALMSAMNQSDVPGLRALVEEYRSAYPEDEYGLQHGYTLVADCLDRLTSERQEQARHYWRTNRSSTVRRFIRRYCLERPASAG